jgi:hypothetical protein
MTSDSCLVQPPASGVLTHKTQNDKVDGRAAEAAETIRLKVTCPVLVVYYFVSQYVDFRLAILFGIPCPK